MVWSFNVWDSTHPSIHPWWHWTAEPIRPFPDDRTNELKRRMQWVYWSQREPVLVNIGTKDISKDIYPSLLLPLPSLPLSPFPYSLKRSKPPPSISLSALLLSLASPREWCRFPPDTHFASYTIPCSCPLLSLFHLYSILNFFLFYPCFITSLPCVFRYFILDKWIDR